MQISQNLKLKQSQSLVMTPQLQQAIKLLQLNNLELSNLINKELEENPFLENESSEEFKEVTNEKTEDLILDSLKKIKGKVTIIFISHRKRTLSICDQIIEVKDGKILISKQLG